jgi:hypothetical protein
MRMHPWLMGSKRLTLNVRMHSCRSVGVGTAVKRLGCRGEVPEGSCAPLILPPSMPVSPCMHARREGGKEERRKRSR